MLGTMKYQKVKIFLVILFSILLLKTNFAQEAEQPKLSGTLYLDANNLSYNPSQTKITELNLDASQKKSPLLAGILSGILPGAGEFYAERYLKAGIIFVVEAAAITTAIIYNNKGDSQTQSFQNYANQNWNVAKYAAWTIQHISNVVNANSDPTLSSNPDQNVKNYNIFPGGNPPANTTDWSQYRVDWNELNKLESAISGGYSHMLPHFGEQQYYELIGKYPQYSHGWNTAVMSDNDFHTLTPQMVGYAHQRAVANDYYADSKTAIIIIYINHFMSIFDAVWSVDNYNKSLAVNFRMQNGNINYSDRLELVPTINISYNF